MQKNEEVHDSVAKIIQMTDYESIKFQIKNNKKKSC